MKKTNLFIVGLAALSTFGIASAATVTVTPGDSSWVNPPSENGGGGDSAITNAAARSGSGSIELNGDRTRFVGLGNFYSSSSNIGLLSSLSGFTFDWMVATGSTQGATPNYSPALRLHIFDGIQRSELIWENAYNGPTPVGQGVWNTTGIEDNFWRFESGIGDSLIYNNSISDWKSVYSANAYISGISVGVGSSAGSGYHAFADNVTLSFGNESTTYNFEPEGASVPDSGSTLALMGSALLGLAAWKRKSKA